MIVSDDEDAPLRETNIKKVDHLLEESFWIVVRIDVDFCQGVVSGRFIAAFVNPGLEPGQDQLQAVALLDLFDQLVSAELAPDNLDQVLDDVLGTVDIL